MSSAAFEAFYREIFADLTVSKEERAEITQRFTDANPPPDKLVWLRSAAFRIGSEFLVTSDGDGDEDGGNSSMTSNISLLRSINSIVHSLELTCMSPKSHNEGNDDDDDDSFNEEKVEDFYRKVYADSSVDQEENQQLYDFFTELKPAPAKLVWMRSAAFRIASEFLIDDKGSNVSLFKCINVVVNALERTCMTPKTYQLKVNPPVSINIDAVGVESSISQAAQYLWDLDVNRLTPGEDYEINVQEGKKPFWKDDKADDPLFTKVDRRAFSRPTYKAFIALLDNYSAQTGVKEAVTNLEKQENWTFLRAIMQSGPMQFCHKYCVANGSNIPEDKEDFMKLLYRIWFQLYKRDRYGEGNDSSGFEHVFVGEIKNEKVSGFHNWIYYYMEEMKGTVDYRGYIKPRSYNQAETNNDDHVLTIQFHWNGIEKAVGTSFIGVSPEFEMALYTICFLVGEENNTIDLNTGTDEFKLNCKVYKFGDKISTSFVEAIAHYD